MHDSIKLLFEEHSIIVNAIDVARQAGSLIGKDDEQYERTVRKLIQFFRQYADGFHHHKEEEILFPEMAKKNELLGEGVIKEMFEHHEDFREMIKGIEKFLDAKEYSSAQLQLKLYTEALLDHIAVENDEVFQMAESIFDEKELDRINFRFQDCDNSLGIIKNQQLAESAEMLRKENLFL